MDKKSANKGDLFSRWAGRIQPQWKTAFLSALLVGLAAHLYKFTNTLYNHDSLYSVYTANDMVDFGRWFLAAACFPSSFFDLPWLNGLLSLLYIGLTAAVLVELFHLRRRASAALTGALLAVFPSVTATFFYEFIADGFMLAMLLAALSVRLNLVGDRTKWHLPVSALLLCLTCGIYQAYVSFALLLSMSHFILALTDPERDIRDCRRWIGRQFIVYGGGLLAYYVVWKLRLALLGAEATSYQGMDQIGILSPAGFLDAVKETARTLASFLLGGDVFQYGWTLYAVLNALFLLLLAGALAFAAVKAGLLKKPERLILLALSVLSLPFFACVWLFVSPGVRYHGVMLQSLCLLYILLLALAERWPRAWPRAASGLLMAALVFKFTLMANAAYFEMERCNRRTLMEATEMLTRIHMQDDGSVTRVAFVGGGEQSIAAAGGFGVEELPVLAHQISMTLLYDHTHASLLFTNVLDSGYTPLTDGELEALIASGQTEDMPAWPRQGSVRVLGDTAVVRLPDVPEDTE